MFDVTRYDTFVKICGITTVEDAMMSIDAGTDAIGVILSESKRQVSLETARSIALTVGATAVRVGVVRDADLATLRAVLDTVPIDVVQWHGTLDDDVVRSCRQRGVGVIKALAVGTADFIDFDESRVDAVLIDGPVPGSGVAHSWAQMEGRRFTTPAIGAGGLTPTSVAALIESSALWGVDVASGVEASPGVKDRDLVVDFIWAARTAFANRRDSSD